jgi:hypothetical protein
MKIAIRSLFSMFIAFTFAQVAAAQMGMGGPPSFAGVFSPTVGSGSSYEMVKKEGGERTTFDIYVVDKEAGGYWIEYAMQNPRMGGSVYMKSLLARQADDVMVQRTIVQMPGRPPMEMTSMMKMHPMQSQQSKADMRANAQNMGTESVTTPAGTFSCQHWRSTKDETDVWLSDKVTPWNLVKMSGPNNTMTLVKVITGAKSHITGTPVSMEDMMKQHMGKPE